MWGEVERAEGAMRRVVVSRGGNFVGGVLVVEVAGVEVEVWVDRLEPLVWGSVVVVVDDIAERGCYGRGVNCEFSGASLGIYIFRHHGALAFLFERYSMFWTVSLAISVSSDTKLWRDVKSVCKIVIESEVFQAVALHDPC